MIKRRGVFFKRMLLLYAVSTTIIFLLFGLAMNVYEQKNYIRQIQELNERRLAQSANAVSYTHLDVYKRQTYNICFSVLKYYCQLHHL